MSSKRRIIPHHPLHADLLKLADLTSFRPIFVSVTEEYDCSQVGQISYWQQVLMPPQQLSN